MKLNVLERIGALNLLPTEGNFATLIVVREAREILSLKEAEIAEFDFKNIPLEGNQVSMTWNDLGKEEREIELGKTATRLIEDKLKELNNEKKLKADQESLYTKFVTE